MTTKKSLTVLLFLLVSFTSKIKAQISCEASFNVAMSVTNKLRAIFTNTSTPDIPGSTQYTWDFGDGDTTSIKNPSHIYAGPGNYIVKLAMRNFGLNACTDTTTYNLLILGSTSINEINSSINLNCYPNPIINTAAINYSLQKEEEIEIYVLDILGKNVMQLESGIKQAGKQELNWDTTSLASGIYFIQLKTKEQLFSKKIVISK